MRTTQANQAPPQPGIPSPHEMDPAHPRAETVPSRRAFGRASLWLVLAGLLLLAVLAPRSAIAGCYWTDAWGNWTATPPPAATNNGSTIYMGAVQINIDGTTTTGLAPGVGNPAGTTGFTKVANLQCEAGTTAYLANQNGGAPTDAAGTLFPTEIQGIGYKINAQGTPIPANGHASFGWTNNVSSYNLAYYITSLYPPYYQLPANTPMAALHTRVCMDANVDAAGKYVSCNSYQDAIVQEFVAGSLTVNSSGCALDINDKDISVILPTIQTGDLTGTGTTLGKTRFTIHLIGCAPTTTVKITLDSNAKSTSLAGVIKPTSGLTFASNVGIQLLRADGTTAVSFGTEVDHGNPSGPPAPGPQGQSGPNMNLDFYARYYQTGTPVSGGKVEGHATFTVTYY